ncbi:MAG: universal stress protein [Candidatus Melainabacteria bacterium]|nr:universal stress protein [Candidatus Melainabacteria bacterium]
MKVLVALDQSDCSEMALDSVLKRKWPANSEFRLISVFEPVASMCVGWNASYVPIGMIEAEQSMRKERKKFVEQKVEEAKKCLADYKICGQVLDGYANHTIVEEAEHWNADLIVLGSHGRSGLSRLFLGSVAEAVAGHARCSVEIIKGHPLTDDANVA